MNNEGFEVFALDEFEELETGAVQEVVSRHCFVYDVKDGDEVFLLSDLTIVEFIL